MRELFVAGCLTSQQHASVSQGGVHERERDRSKRRVCIHFPTHVFYLQIHCVGLHSLQYAVCFCSFIVCVFPVPVLCFLVLFCF